MLGPLFSVIRKTKISYSGKIKQKTVFCQTNMRVYKKGEKTPKTTSQCYHSLQLLKTSRKIYITLPKLRCMKRKRIELGTRDIERRQDWNYTNRLTYVNKCHIIQPIPWMIKVGWRHSRTSMYVSDGCMILIYVMSGGLIY